MMDAVDTDELTHFFFSCTGSYPHGFLLLFFYSLFFLYGFLLLFFYRFRAGLRFGRVLTTWRVRKKGKDPTHVEDPFAHLL